MKHFSITKENAYLYQEKLKIFESQFTYPLGRDKFRIDHGKNYFSFFDCLGEWKMSGLENDSGIIATLLGVLRKIGEERVWYLGDLKVLQEYRNHGISLELINQNINDYVQVSNKFYAVAMMDVNESNSVNKIISQIKKFKIDKAGVIEFFTLSFDQIIKMKIEIEKIVGPISFLNLEGIKDLILGSTKKRMPLVHIQHGNPFVPGNSWPEKESIFMVCGAEGGELAKLMLGFGIGIMGKATIYQNNFPEIDLNRILTSEI